MRCRPEFRIRDQLGLDELDALTGVSSKQDPTASTFLTHLHVGSVGKERT